MRQRLQIRALTAALVVMFSIVIGFQAWILALGHQRAIDVFSTRAANRAHATAKQVAATLQQVDLLLVGIRDTLDADEVMAGVDPASPRIQAMRELLRGRMARQAQVMWMHVVSADGRVVFSTQDPVPGIRIDDRKHFKEQSLATRDELHVSEILLSRSTGRWAMFPNRRLTTTDGRFAGIILAAIDTEALGTVLTAVDQQQWIFALCDGSGRLAARRPYVQDQIGRTVDPVLQALVRGSEGLVAPALGEHAAMIWQAMPVDGLPLVTVAGFSHAQALAQWHRDLRVHLAVAVLLAAGLVAIILLHRRNIRAAESLRISEEYYRTLFDAAPDAIAVLEGGRVIDANSCYGQLFKVSTGHPVPPWEMAPPTQPDGAASPEQGRRLCAEALGGTLQQVSWRCQRSDGSQFDADLVLSRFHHTGRDLLIAVVRDLTRMRELEEKLRQGQKLEALGQLAGGVAHDFNNMLAAILGSAEIIATRSSDDRIRRYNSTIVSAAERASQLTRKLLSFARKGKILSSPIDLHQLLRETVGLLERTVDPRVVISLRLDAPSASVVGDPAQIQNAMLNLCLNARDAMPQGGSLVISTAVEALEGDPCRVGSFAVEPGEYVRISVRDTGCGIAAADLGRIFDPFFTTKEVGKGTGLGLASVYGTMVSHKGAISVESEVGRGTVFSLFFARSAGQAPDAPPEADMPQGSGPVLVVDDEDMVRTSIAMQLEELGYTPIQAGDVATAEAAFRARHSELAAVLLDLVMPTSSGADVALRLHGIDPKVPVILISGFPRNAEIKSLLGQGVSGFLQKPFRQADLARTLASLRRGTG